MGCRHTRGAVFDTFSDCELLGNEAVWAEITLAYVYRQNDLPDMLARFEALVGRGGFGHGEHGIDDGF